MSLSQFIKQNYINSLTSLTNESNLAGDVGHSGIGVVVRRAAAADPVNSVYTSIFTVTGQVIMTFVIGVRTIIQAGGASNIRFQHNGFAATVLSAATATSATDAVGTTYSITGNVTDNVLIGAGGAGGSVPVLAGIMGGISTAERYQRGILMNAGDLQIYFSAAAATGSTAWTIIYIPISVGATVVAV